MHILLLINHHNSSAVPVGQTSLGNILIQLIPPLLSWLLSCFIWPDENKSKKLDWTIYKHTNHKGQPGHVKSTTNNLPYPISKVFLSFRTKIGCSLLNVKKILFFAWFDSQQQNGYISSAKPLIEEIKTLCFLQL